MRVSEETLNRGWVGMGWWAIGLLVGAYNTTHQQHFLVKACALTQISLLRWLSVCARGGVVYVYQLVYNQSKLQPQQVREITDTK